MSLINGWLVKRAQNADVERTHLNKILQEIASSIVSGGTVTSVSVTTANGVSGSVATATTTPAITLTLGAITPSSVAAAGTVTGSNLSGTNTGDKDTVTAVSSSSGVLTLDLSLGSYFTCTLTENITSIVFSNAPASGKGQAFSIHFTQHASSAKTITGWPANTKWFGGTYAISTALSAVDEVGITYYSSTKILGKYAQVAV